MGKPVAGEVVVLPLPQTDLLPGKRRPALVVAELVGNDLILCQITSQIRSDPYSVSQAATDFEHGRLTVASYVRTNRVFTVDQSVILYSAARVTRRKLDEVKTKIRELFA